MNRTRPIASLLFMLLLTACGGPPVPVESTAAPAATQSAEPSPGETKSVLPSRGPTPSPLTRIQSGEWALFNGDFEAARVEFNAAYRDSQDPQVRAAALWGLGRTDVQDLQYSAALSWLEQLLAEYPDSAFVPYAHFLLGQINFELDRFPEAANGYAQYLKLRPGALDAYVQELRGQALFEAGAYGDALSAYEAALTSAGSGDSLSLELKIAATREEIGDYASAIGTYEAIFTNTENDYLKAQMEYLAGMAYLEIEQPEPAYGKFLHSVENYPLSYYSYLGLIELVNADVPVSDLDRGLVDYFAGQYDVALAALNRYLEAGLDATGTARYYRALTQRELENYESALQDFASFIADYPEHSRWVTAWEEKAFTQWYYVGDYRGGAQTLLDFVESGPTRPEAVGFLMSAGRVLERDNRLEEAARVWQRVADDYPDSEQTAQALFLAGIAHYRRGDFYQALPVFQRSLLLSTEKEDQARAYLWVGKTQQQLGDQSAMETAWQQAQSLDPTGYYSERARDLLIDQAPFAPPAMYDIEVDLAAERGEAAAWLRIQFELPPDTDLEGLGPLAGNPHVVRGTEFWELGLYEMAREEFEALREEVSASPENSFRLANYLLDLGMYRSAVFAARQVLTLAGMEEQATTLSAPPYFNHLRYGTYFADLVIPTAEEYDLHPLLFFSIIRQESLFEGFVRSTAGARGLMQIIPSTGADVAKSLGWPVAFDPEDLYRPNVSVRLGAHYLATNRGSLNDDLYAALAAYNAGPGNARIWKELAGDDPDLLLEIIRFKETRDYIRYIYEIFAIYESLYSQVY